MYLNKKLFLHPSNNLSMTSIDHFIVWNFICILLWYLIVDHTINTFFYFYFDISVDTFYYELVNLIKA